MKDGLCFDNSGVITDEFLNPSGQIQQIVLKKHVSKMKDLEV